MSLSSNSPFAQLVFGQLRIANESTKGAWLAPEFQALTSIICFRRYVPSGRLSGLSSTGKERIVD